MKILQGKCITDVTKHLETKILRKADAMDAVNHPLFSAVSQLDPETFEMSFAKGKIKFELPALIAHFVYNYAKLRYKTKSTITSTV